MTTQTKIRTARSALLALVVLGICLVGFALLVGGGLPGLIVSVAGWLALIIGLVGLVVAAVQKSNATSHTAAWNPTTDGDQ